MTTKKTESKKQVKKNYNSSVKKKESQGIGARIKKNKGIAVAIVLLIVFFAITKIAMSIEENKKRIYEGLKEAVEEQNYPLSELKEDGYFVDEYNFRSYNDGSIVSRRGIDVSEHQGYIDWELVKESGVEFAFVRVGYRTYDNGNIREDIYFRENIEGALNNGIEVGVYFFSQAITLDEAIDEAQYIVDQIKGYNITLPVVYDMEEVTKHSDRIDALSTSERTEFADAFCTVVENYGYDSLVYGNPTWLMSKLNLYQISDRKIWLAHYAETTHYPFRFEIWQYSDSGVIDGINELVDLNIMFVREE